MSKNTIYLTGLPTFKLAVMANLGHEWSHAAQDINQDLVRFDLPKKMTSKQFRGLIGERALLEHNILFLYNS